MLVYNVSKRKELKKNKKNSFTLKWESIPTKKKKNINKKTFFLYIYQVIWSQIGKSYDYTKKFIILYRIICYSINEFAYNEGLISQDVGFVISRETVYTKNIGITVQCIECEKPQLLFSAKKLTKKDKTIL
jgi:hypothetical protein